MVDPNIARDGDDDFDEKPYWKKKIPERCEKCHYYGTRPSDPDQTWCELHCKYTSINNTCPDFKNWILTWNGIKVDKES